MIPIKILCGCGQKYSFEVEPVNGVMPSPVACPVCGADGTHAANAIVAQSSPAPRPAVQIARAPTAPPSAGVIAPPSARTNLMRPGQVDRAQAETEAKAKISWGDPPNEVVKFLMTQNFRADEARKMVDEMFRERAVTVRRNGIKKIIYGLVMAGMPVIAWFEFNNLVMLSMKLFAFIVMIGLYGLYQALKGTMMTIAPKFEPGDVATQ
jgi:hypothetical protein